MAQLMMKNLLCTENKLSAQWLSELLSNWSKKLLGSLDLVRGHKVKRHSSLHSNVRLEEGGEARKNCSVEFHKFKCHI